MADWIGFMVSVKCKDDLGVYQGEIFSATNKEIVLTKAFCNGIPCSENNVKIRAVNISDIKLIEKQSRSPQQKNTITIAKPIPKRAARSHSASESTNFVRTGNFNTPLNKLKPFDVESPANTNTNDVKNTPIKKEKMTKPHRWVKGSKNEECFGSPLDWSINQDFDFEKNLALFNKEAMWEKLNNAQKPDIVKHAKTKKNTKYRHDENVIASSPTIYRQITVPKQEFCEYVTDDGLIIPCVTRTLRQKLWNAAEKFGLTWERRIELFGRAVTEISIQLLGGGHRLNPHNYHQWPTVVVLCGPNKQGAMGLNSARQLASHGVHTIVYTISSDTSMMKKELTLYALSKNPIVHTISELPLIADLIIIALCEDSESPKSYPELADWANRNKAPVLALDPPSIGTPGITPKFSILPVLPLPHSSNNGKLYLCNLGIPVQVFSEVGIKYKSPFGSNFVIPLHPRED